MSPALEQAADSLYTGSATCALIIIACIILIYVCCGPFDE